MHKLDFNKDYTTSRTGSVEIIYSFGDNSVVSIDKYLDNPHLPECIHIGSALYFDLDHLQNTLLSDEYSTEEIVDIYKYLYKDGFSESLGKENLVKMIIHKFVIKLAELKIEDLWHPYMGFKRDHVINLFNSTERMSLSTGFPCFIEGLSVIKLDELSLLNKTKDPDIVKIHHNVFMSKGMVDWLFKIQKSDESWLEKGSIDWRSWDIVSATLLHYRHKFDYAEPHSNITIFTEGHIYTEKQKYMYLKVDTGYISNKSATPMVIFNSGSEKCTLTASTSYNFSYIDDCRVMRDKFKDFADFYSEEINKLEEENKKELEDLGVVIPSHSNIKRVILCEPDTFVRVKEESLKPTFVSSLMFPIYQNVLSEEGLAEQEHFISRDTLVVKTLSEKIKPENYKIIDL